MSQTDPPDAPVAVGARSGLEYRNLREECAEVLEHLEVSSFPTSDPAELSDAAQFAALARDFPEGGFVGFDRGEPLAMGRICFELPDSSR